MSCAAVVVARDEADIIQATVRHLLWHVDEVLAADHRSVDGTREILAGLPVTLFDVKERGYWGDRNWTWLAEEALEHGHKWLVVADADEIWQVTDDEHRRLADYLAAVDAGVLVVSANAHDYVPTALDDPDEANPVRRIGWRRRAASTRKVACRLRPGFSYAKHNAWYDGVEQKPSVVRGLAVHHFSIRTADQLVSKVRNGMDGYSVEAGMPPGWDYGWVQWKGLTDDEIRERFRAEFWSQDPRGDGLVFDPAPLHGQPE